MIDHQVIIPTKMFNIDRLFMVELILLFSLDEANVKGRCSII